LREVGIMDIKQQIAEANEEVTRASGV